MTLRIIVKIIFMSLTTIILGLVAIVSGRVAYIFYSSESVGHSIMFSKNTPKFVIDLFNNHHKEISTITAILCSVLATILLWRMILRVINIKRKSKLNRQN